MYNHNKNKSVDNARKWYECQNDKIRKSLQEQCPVKQGTPDRETKFYTWISKVIYSNKKFNEK